MFWGKIKIRHHTLLLHPPKSMAASSSNSHSSTIGTATSSFRLPPCPDNAVLNRRRYCHCPNGPHVAVLRVSQVARSFNRVFFSCRHYIDKTNAGCGFFLWAVDEGVATRTAEAIHCLQDTLEHALMTTICTSMKRIEQKAVLLDAVLSSVNKLERKLMETGRLDMHPRAAPRHRIFVVIVLLICLVYYVMRQ